MEALCRVYMSIDKNKLEASGTADFVRECMSTFVGASVKDNSVTVNVINFPESTDYNTGNSDDEFKHYGCNPTEDVNVSTSGNTEDRWHKAAPAADREDKIGDTIAFFTDEDFAMDDENLACTASFDIVSYDGEEKELWRVRTTTDGIPAINEDTTGTEVSHFITRDEVIAYMAKFGFKPV